MPDRQIKINVDIVSGSGGTTKVKGTLNEVSSEVKRINRETSEDAKRTQRVIADATKARVNEEIKEEKRVERERKAAADDFISSIKRVEAESKAAAIRTSSAFSSAFKGGLLGGFVGSISTQLAQLPGMMKSTLDQMVQLAADRQNAFKGLESVSVFKGISPTDAQDAVKNLRFVKSGIIDVADATASLKNLLLTGFNLPEAIKLMEAFSDSSSFAKQGALSYGEAIRGATEGLKNQNSILLDNAGITKNLSVILEEHGKTKADVSKITNDAGVRQAIYNGILQEATAFTGDADRITQGYTGSTAALTTAQNNLYAAIGKQIIQSPELLALIQTMTQELNTNTEAIQKNENQSNSQTKTLVGNFAEIALSAGLMAKNVSFVYEGLGRMLGMVLTGIKAVSVDLLSLIGNAVVGIVIDPINIVIDAINKLGGTISRIPVPEVALSKDVQSLKFQYQDFDKFVAQSQTDDKRIRDEYAANLARTKAGSATAGGFSWLAKGTVPTTPTPPPVTPGAKTPGGTGRIHRAPAESDSEFRQFFTDMGFGVNRTYGRAINDGSPHPYGGAADIDFHGKTSEQITAMLAKALEKGYRVFDERVKAPGVKQTGPHLHIENAKTTLTKSSRFLAPSYYGGEANLAYLQSLDAKRLGKVGGVGDLKEDVARMTQSKQDAEIAAFEEHQKFEQDWAGRIMLQKKANRERLQAIQEQQIAEHEEHESWEKDWAARVTAQKNADPLKQIRAEYELLQKRNLAKEAVARSGQERNDLTRDIGDSQIELAIRGQNDGLKIQAALLRDTLDLRNRDLDAVISINRAQLELSEAMKVSNVQVRAGVYEHIAGQQTMSQAYSSGINQTYDALTRLVNGPLDKLNEKAHGLLSFFTEPMKAVQNQAIGNLFLKVTDKLFPGLGGQMEEAQNPMLFHAKKHTELLQQIVNNTGGTRGISVTGGAGSGGGGSLLNTIISGGLGGGGSQTPGFGGIGIPGFGGGSYSTPPFNGNAGPIDPVTGQPADPASIVNVGGGGILDKLGLGKLFAPQRNPITGNMNSKLAGQMGGIGSIAAMVGGFLPGKLGKHGSVRGNGCSIRVDVRAVGSCGWGSHRRRDRPLQQGR
jgi:hypothetical protein